MNIEEIKQLATPILKEHGVVRASLFGSVTRGEYTPESDIDFLVELPSTLHGFDYVAVKVQLQEDLQDKLGKEVDVVEYKLIKPSLKEYILPTEHKIF